MGSEMCIRDRNLALRLKHQPNHCLRDQTTTCITSIPTKIATPEYIKNAHRFLDRSLRSFTVSQFKSLHIAGSLSNEIGFQQTTQCLCGSASILLLVLGVLLEAATWACFAVLFAAFIMCPFDWSLGSHLGTIKFPLFK